MIPDFIWQVVKRLIPLTGFGLTIDQIQTANTPPDTVIADNLTIKTPPPTVGPWLQLVQTTPAFIWELRSLNIWSSSSRTYPLRISGSYPDHMVIDGNGNIGIHANVPQVKLDVNRDADTGAETVARFGLYNVENEQQDRLQIMNGSATTGLFIPRIQGVVRSTAVGLMIEGIIGSDDGNGPCVAYNAAKYFGGALNTRPLVVYRNNDAARVTIAANGDMFATTFSPVSSRTMKDHIVDLDFRDADQALQQMTPVEFVYKDDFAGRQHIGFIAEDVPEIIAEPGRMSVPLMDAVAVVTAVVKGQDQAFLRRQQAIAELQETIDTQQLLFAQSPQAIDSNVDDLKKAINEQSDTIDDMLKRVVRLESLPQKYE